MAKVLSTDDRIYLEVEERGLVPCKKCNEIGEVLKPEDDPATHVAGTRPKCPFCLGFKQVPGQEVLSTVKYELSPLSWPQKQEILSQNRMVSGQVISDDARRTMLGVKYAVKGVEGLKWFDPAKQQEVDWHPTFEKDGSLDNKSLDMILNASMTLALTKYCQGLVGGIPLFVVDPVTGLAMPGVKVTLPGGIGSKN